MVKPGLPLLLLMAIAACTPSKLAYGQVKSAMIEAGLSEPTAACMAVFDVEKAKTIMFIKRSMGGVGYAGVDNDVFYMDQTMMLLADAKKMVEDINKALSH